MKKSLLITSILAILLFTQCSKCHDEELSPRLFSQEDLKIVPYYDKDTIRLTSSNNESLFLYGTINNMRMLFMENDPSSDAFALHNCRGQYFETYYYDVGFSDTLYCSISIRLRFTNIFHEKGDEKLIFLSFRDPDKSIGGFNGKFQFNNDSLFMSKYPLANELIEGYVDTLMLGSHIYFNVYKLSSGTISNSQREYSDWVQKLYYSVSEGFVGVSLKSGKYYYLDNGK